MLDRREVAARRFSGFHRLAAILVKTGLTPNMISVASALFALLAGYSLAQMQNFENSFYQFWFLAVFGIQMRLVCNLIDGLMAVEGGLKSLTGDIYNDFPDRISDIFILLGAGYALPFSWGKDLGWIASVIAVLTAYVRVLGASLNCGHDFKGPMAKQHRMGVLTLALVSLAIEKYIWNESTWSLTVGLALIAAGGVVTVILRLKRLARKLHTR